MRRRTRTLIGASAFLAVAATATASWLHRAGNEPDAPAPDPTAKAVEAWRVDLPVVGQPAVAGDVAVVYSARQGKLTLHAVDVATGELLWDSPASPGAVVTGIATGPTIVGEGDEAKVAYLRPNTHSTQQRPLSADLVVAAPRSGKVLATKKNQLFTSPPHACEDDQDVCVTSHPQWYEPRRAHRLDVDNGTYRKEPGAPRDSRPLGPTGLVSLDSRDPEKLARVKDGKVVWRLPVALAFPFGASSDYGWGFGHHEKEDLYIGWLGGPVWRDEKGRITRSPLEQRGMAAIDVAAGTVRWKSAGVPCLDRDDAEKVNVRCLDRGVGKPRKKSTKYRWSGVDSTIEGYDPASGRTTWTVEVGPGKEPFEIRDVPHAGGTDVAVRTSAGDRVVDLADGETRTPATGEVFACVVSKKFRYEEPYPYEAGPEHRRYGTGLVSPCDAMGKATDDAPGAYSLSAVAQEAGVHHLVSMRGALVAYRAL